MLRTRTLSASRQITSCGDGPSKGRNAHFGSELNLCGEASNLSLRMVGLPMAEKNNHGNAGHDSVRIAQEAFPFEVKTFQLELVKAWRDGVAVTASVEPHHNLIAFVGDRHA
jgi:hypothetical protein